MPGVGTGLGCLFGRLNLKHQKLFWSLPPYFKVILHTPAMNNIRYTFGHEGQSHFLRPAIDALAAVEPFFESAGWQYDSDYFARVPALYQSRQVTALGGLDVAGIVMCFIGSCFAKKIFDEVYERTVKRPIGIQLDRLLAAVQLPSGKII